MTTTKARRPCDGQVWFVTGASRGFGLEIARQVLARGDALVATARDPRSLERSLTGSSESLLTTSLDVTDERQARAAGYVTRATLNVDGGFTA